ncbi:MAG TPA: HypC/HybG/HupF family hydrogenase formation chaperone [Candidatus Binatia bacterium]|nr:HypC/HybG/HupF family hydrogenase formation chaperone [Candidatus Binatia bacterium]
MCLGIPGEVVALGDRPGMATVEVGGVRRPVNVMLVEQEGVEPGDWVLIHVGFALARIDEEEARLTLDHLEKMGQAYQDELRALAASRAG